MGRNIFNSFELQDKKEGAWNQIFRSGNWMNSYKNFQVKPKELDDFVKNFDSNILGTKELQVNYGHASYDKAAGWITSLRRKGKHLEAQIRWTPEASKKIADEEWRYFSAEIDFAYKDQESGEVTKNVLLGAALTNIPFVRGMKAVALSDVGLDAEKSKTILYFNNHNMDMFKKLLSTLQGKTSVSLDEVALLKDAMTNLSDEEAAEVKSDVKEVEEKAEETAKADEESAKAEEEKAAKKDEELSDLRKKVELSQKDGDTKVTELSTQLSNTQKELDQFKSERRSEKVDARVQKLCEKGQILPAQSKDVGEFALALSESKAEAYLKQFEAMPARVDFDEKGGSSQEGDSQAILAVKVKEAMKKDENLSQKDAVAQVMLADPGLAQSIQ